MTQFVYYNYFKLFPEVLHPNPNIFVSDLVELENWPWQELGGGGSKSTHGAATDSYFSIFAAIASFWSQFQARALLMVCQMEEALLYLKVGIDLKADFL